MNATIVETGLIASLFFITISGVFYVWTGSSGKLIERFHLFKNHFQKTGINNDTIGEQSDPTRLWRKWAIIISFILIIALVGFRFFHPELFYYILPCILFVIVVLNMDSISRLRRNTDFAGGAAMGYLIFISYLILMILFLFLGTIYFSDSEIKL